jgi:RNA polymerase sigma-70 factor, ECF subfamily
LAAGTDDKDERTLIEAAQADPACFVELYDRCFHRVYAFVSRRTGNRAIAEDVTSEVFEQALANLRKFEWRGTPFVAWLLRIASNALADRWRQSARDSSEALPDVPDARETEDLERRAMLLQLVERLPGDQRRVIELRFGEERSLRDIAHVLERSEGAVKQLQLRALENLRKGMGARHG